MIKGNWTPLHLKIMLHHYAECGSFPNDSKTAREYLQHLIADGLVELSEDIGGEYRATEKGRVFVGMLCSTPVPIQNWIDPRETLPQ